MLKGDTLSQCATPSLLFFCPSPPLFLYSGKEDTLSQCASPPFFLLKGGHAIAACPPPPVLMPIGSLGQGDTLSQCAAHPFLFFSLQLPWWGLSSYGQGDTIAAFPGTS